MSAAFPRTDAPIVLARRAMLTLPDAAGLAIACRSGSLWVTLDDDPRDFIIAAGEQFRTAEHRSAIVYALDASVLVVKPAHATPPPRARRAGVPGWWPVFQPPVAMR